MNVGYDFLVGTFFGCQTVDIGLMTLFLFTTTFYLMMTLWTTRTGESKFSSPAAEVGLSVEG